MLESAKAMEPDAAETATFTRAAAPPFSIPRRHLAKSPLRWRPHQGAVGSCQDFS